MEFIERNRLLKKLVAIVLIAAMIVGSFPVRPAEAAIQEIIAGAIILACEAALKKLMPKLTEAAGGSLEAAAKTFLHETMIIHEMNLRHDLEKKLYDLDHKPLDSNAVGGSLGGFLTNDFYGKASISDTNFDAANPGYRNVSPGRPAVIFSGVYAERMTRLLRQGKAKLNANFAMGMSLLNSGNPAGIGAIQSVHDPLMDAGEYLEKGYRELLQAKSQIHTMSNKQASALRATETARNDAAVRYALNERQEKTDKIAAFEQAVRQWKPITQNAAY
jgi:hypothetical protein